MGPTVSRESGEAVGVPLASGVERGAESEERREWSEERGETLIPIASPSPSSGGEGEEWRSFALGDLLENGASAMGVTLTEVQRDRCLRYLEMLLDWNTRMNLTAIRDPHEAVVKHFLDSMTAVEMLPEGKAPRVVDVGTGAGFPGLVMKIMRPEIRLLLLDSVKKRLTFLEAVAGELGLEGVETLHARAEDAGGDRKLRERMDGAVARAVADLRVLSELCLPLVKVGGRFIAMKGPRGEEELQAAQGAIRMLGGRVVESRSLALPYLNEARKIIVIEKERPTPVRYPRRPTEIQKQPL